MSGKLIMGKRLFLVDAEDFWREFSHLSLNAAGCNIKTYNSYEGLKAVLTTSVNPPDLIIVGCSKPSPKEVRLIRYLRARKFRQLVLCSFFSRDEMKSLFFAGADDVSEKPFTSLRLISTIEESLDNIACRQNI